MQKRIAMAKIEHIPRRIVNRLYTINSGTKKCRTEILRIPRREDMMEITAITLIAITGEPYLSIAFWIRVNHPPPNPSSGPV
jgi:hypothetical protein